ncbi:F-box/WD repeat-containing protein 8 [Periophthalmus magnuspinnatus]|uniref:F-box/WD repeat-containing protein 8 n=1 Tax=Periophthalmus magnuspinnatus TaxID=409849 RepID=UPI00145AA725|nr:F-box/WD repeat-containing protein 8 [Periophthalmus magnuspinnatus]
MAEDDELAAFRKRWQQELTNKKEEQGIIHGDSTKVSSQKDSKKRYFEEKDEHRNDKIVPVDKDEGVKSQDEEEQPQYVSIVESLLDGQTRPLLDRLEQDRSKRRRQNETKTALQHQRLQNKVKKQEQLVDQLILDLNEVDDIPFFDIDLPYELALKIFQYLSCKELGRCAQVSRAWRVLAEDGVLWFRLCMRAGFHQDASVSDSPCWKSTLRDCRNSAKAVCSNWKNRVGSVSQLQFELGKVLCDVNSCENFVFAGYTSGDVRLWDTFHWDSGASYLKPNGLSANTEPRPYISLVQVNRTVAAAAYDDGCVDVWSTETGGQPIYHYHCPERIRTLALSPDGPVLGSSSGSDIRLDRPDDCGYWRTVCQAQLPNTVESLVVLPGKEASGPVASAAAGDSVYLLDSRTEEPRPLHSVYGHPVTCLDASQTQVAFGVKRSGWAMHDGGNKIHVYSLESGKAEVCMGSSAGDFTCINLRDSPPQLLVCGNKDRRVRVFDLRTGASVSSLYAHHLGVTAVQTDEWKIVSGGGEGLVCVWDMRTGTKLWEMHNRHPVRHIRFSGSRLVTANIPDDKAPRGACITDDDLTAHRRHRGVICHYDFSEDALSHHHILPICRSDYTGSHGYNYNISLTVPYDRLSGSHPSV